MPRSRRFLALASLIAALSWINVQAMTCCWSLGLAAALPEAAFATSSRDGEARFADAEPTRPACHGPATTRPASRATPEPEAAVAPAADQASAPSTPSSPSSPSSCRDVAAVFSSAPSTTSTASCCETPAPAESFSALLRLEALPPHAFYAAAAAPSGVARDFPSALHSPGAPRFLALERLLI